MMELFVCNEICQVLASYFSCEPHHPYLPSIGVSTVAGPQPAGLMMSGGTDGFCCHLD